MSFNLQTKEVDLWQTPTWVTKICLYKDGYNQDNWENVYFRYRIWVESHTDVRWENEEDYNSMEISIKNHLETLEKAIKRYKKLKFYAI